MRHRAMLEAQLADAAGRQRRREVERDVAAAWRADPAVLALEARLAAAPAGDGVAILEAAEPLLADLGWLKTLLAALARAATADPLFEPPFRPLADDRQTGLALIEHPRLRVSLIVLPADAVGARKVAALGERSITFPGHHSLLRFVQAEGAAIDLWEAPPAGPEFRTADAGRASSAGRIDLADGMLLRFDGACQSWTWARMPRDAILLQAVTREGAAPLAIEYRACDGGFLAAHAGDGAESRLRLLARMLARMQRRDAAPVLMELAGEGAFDRRWALARATVALDSALGRILLRRMAAGDPHPEIRAAAEAALGRMPA